jgi:hypothetical protein
MAQTNPQDPNAAQPEGKPSGGLSALNKLRLPLRVGKGAQLATNLVKAKVLLWAAAGLAAAILLFLLLLLVIGMSGASAGGTLHVVCEGESTAVTLAPGGGILVGASEYGGPGDPTTSGDKGAFGSLDGQMAYAELGLSGAGDSNWEDARKIGEALGLSKALPPHALLQITADGHSVIAEKLDVGAGGGPVGSPPHERVIDLWYQTAAALGLDTTNSGQWSGLVRIQLVQAQSATPLQGSSPPVSSAAGLTFSGEGGALGTSAATADARSQHASPVGFAVANSQGQIVASYEPTATDYGHSITESMLLVAFLRQNAGRPLSSAARSNLSTMIDQASSGNGGPGADWVYRHLHNADAQVKQVAHEAGMSDFLLNTSDPVYVLGHSRVSAGDMARLFSKIAQLLPTSLQAYGLSLLSEVSPGGPQHTGIYDAKVASWPVYSTSGWDREANGSYTFNQAALINVAGQQYAIAVITAKDPSYAVGEGIVKTIAIDLFKPLLSGTDTNASASCGENQPVEENGNLGGTIVQIAQSQLGQSEHPPGSNCTMYGPCEKWCALFATWVWKHAGINIPSMGGSSEIYTWGKEHSKVLPPTATPAPGDAVEFGNGPGDSEHVGIVEKVFPDGEIIMISGNWNNEVAPSQPFQPAQAAKESGSGFPIYGYVVP